jgi:hypothetical protein
MYLLVRKALRTANTPMSKHFSGRKSSAGWIRSYREVARIHALPIWPIYVHWASVTAILVVLTFWISSLYFKREVH